MAYPSQILPVLLALGYLLFVQASGVGDAGPCFGAGLIPFLVAVLVIKVPPKAGNKFLSEVGIKNTDGRLALCSGVGPLDARDIEESELGSIYPARATNFLWHGERDAEIRKEKKVICYYSLSHDNLP